MTFKNIIWKYALFGLLITYALFTQKLFAQAPVTPEPEIINPPILLINEVQFKNSKNDWIELYVFKGGSIKNYKLKDDSAFLEINEELEVKNNEYILIYFKSPEEKYEYKDGVHYFYITKSGLTGTTEQVVLYNKDEIIDAVCWVSNSPTSGEIEDFNELNEHWVGTKITSCINSEEINTGDSIFRLNLIDTNTKYDWIKNQTATAGEFNLITEECICECEEVVCEEITCDENLPVEEEEIKEDPLPEKAGFTAPDCWNSIKINEVFPNPSGSDTGNEWIELYNESDENCDLSGLFIDDIEGGSKAFEIKETMVINKKGYLLLPSWQTKIILNNTEDSVRILNHENKILNTVSYEDTSDDQSFSKNNEGEFLWTSNTTPLTENIFDEIIEEVEEEESDDDDEEPTVIVSGTSSDNIHITEVFPNPEGKDSGNEWIEIYNDSEESINLVNWVIKTSEDGKKQYVFGDTLLEAFEYFTISDKEMGLTLRNSNGELYLMDHQKNIIDSITYDESKENESYMKINIINDEDIENEWKWTKNITPSEENINLYEFEGEVIEFNKKESELTLQTGKLNENLLIKVLQTGESTTEFIKGSTIKVTLKTNENDDYMLENYELIGDTEIAQEPSQGNYLYLILSSLPPLGFLSYMGLRKFNILKFA